MKSESVIVFGAGRFGAALAEELFRQEIEVMIIDENHDIIQEIAPRVTTAIKADVLDEHAMEELGLKNFDLAVIAIGSSLEASIVATVAAKEHGIPMIYAKASTEMQARILKKVGADHIIFPEVEMAERLAMAIAKENIMEYIHFSEDYSIVEVSAPKSWVGKSISELDVRNKYHINIIGMNSLGKTIISPHSSEVIHKDDKIIIIGEDKMIKELESND